MKNNIDKVNSIFRYTSNTIKSFDVVEYYRRLDLIQSILRFSWDPLHMMPVLLHFKKDLDEYDSYADICFDFIEMKLSVQEIAEILACIAEQYMEICVDPDREWRTAELLHEV